jgi:hypothetical protein
MEFKSLLDIVRLKSSDTVENCNPFLVLEHLRFCGAMGVNKRVLRLTCGHFSRPYAPYIGHFQFSSVIVQ